ncbi:alpha/beta hydrolase [Gluconobacter kanchanaburiensis]|uniref:Alpha/beta hydrolase n=2 Tax=Gluconobacter kanchanaburiensis TaxID=563199 RepID=A0A511B9V6_9PROT|nr:alpha/beta fold hydrolase [Gluconobacter kanchanaburiensis]MBF0862869.1 alpha/beta fold hydrolase [Gluconobacter kanchanaburiensis]GBR71986.1 hydrolase [Gluconobacter kanchanaburiensis NBRC 103587]GEK97206.1 alpha/beta hydrolase [Gluconobacter kanchanaburiensis NBRC 103587]
MTPRIFRLVMLLSGMFGAASQAFAAQQEAIEAPGPQGPLAGTFVNAGPGKPVLLLIPGSGPTDRDGNSALGPKPATLKQLADGLALHGISSVRIDKRGMFGSRKAIPDGNHVTIADYVADVRNWIAVIRSKIGAHCVWLAGHSEGGLVALATVQTSVDICGLILVSTPGRPLGEVLREQLHALPSARTVLPQIDKTITALEAGRHVDVQSLHPGLRGLFHPAVQDFMIDLFRHDPAGLLKAYHGPVLIMQGGADKQVSATADLPLLKTADPQADIILLPNASHSLADLGTSPAPDGSLLLDGAVVPDIAEFVRKH